MANAYVTNEPCMLEEIIEAALEDGFATTDEVWANGMLKGCGLIHEDGRGCYDMCEQDGDDGWIYVGSMNDPEVPGHEMHPDQA